MKSGEQVSGRSQNTFRFSSLGRVNNFPGGLFRTHGNTRHAGAKTEPCRLTGFVTFKKRVEVGSGTHQARSYRNDFDSGTLQFRAHPFRKGRCGKLGRSYTE